MAMNHLHFASSRGRESVGRRWRQPRCRSGAWALLLLLPLFLAGCDLSTLPGFARPFAEHRLYTYDFFDSFEECVQAQPYSDFWLNCSQTANFCPNGRVELMVTDIIHGGTYKVAGRNVTLSLPQNPEVASRVHFALSRDGQAMTERSTEVVWKRKAGEELAEARRSCFPLD